MRQSFRRPVFAAAMIGTALNASVCRAFRPALLFASSRSFGAPSRRRVRSTEAVGMKASASAPGETSSYPSLHGKNLVSIGECLEAWDASKAKSEDVGGSIRGLVFVDGSWYHRGGRNGRAEFEAGPRIPNSVHVDMDDIAAKGDLNPKNLPHMLPPKELFAAAMDAFGIANNDHVVVYGKDGCVFTPRTFFLFRSMGHDPSCIHLMQGSFEEWAEAGGGVETGPTTVLRAENLDLECPPRYQARDASNVCDMDHVLRAVDSTESGGGGGAPILLDPRGTTFDAGHVPGAINVPYLSIVEKENWLKFRPREELLAVFERAGVDVRTDRQIICTCGSGVSVCHLFLALEECGRDNTNTVIYDGSWAEWGADESTPKASSRDHS